MRMTEMVRFLSFVLLRMVGPLKTCLLEHPVGAVSGTYSVVEEEKANVDEMWVVNVAALVMVSVVAQMMASVAFALAKGTAVVMEMETAVVMEMETAASTTKQSDVVLVLENAVAVWGSVIADVSRPRLVGLRCDRVHVVIEP
jgi:hypothetical protein